MTKRKHAPPRNAREALLDGVGQIIREHGIGFVSLREVARRAKVSHGAPGHFFKNKSGLLAAFATQGYERLAQSVVEAVARADAKDGPTQLERLGAAYVKFAVAHPEQFAIMFRPATREIDGPALLLAREATYGVLLSTLQRCAREGMLEGIDLDLAAVSAWSMVHGLAMLWLSGRLSGRTSTTDVDRLAASVSGLFVDAVLRRKLPPARRGR
jgi:AcrR family transcriptional regulator